MISLELLFEETNKTGKEYTVSDIQKKIISPNLNISAKDIPVVPPPKEGTGTHMRDLDAVKHCILNPCLTPKFLEISHSNAEQIFKRYSDQVNLNIDTQFISDLCNQFDDIVMELKNYYNRARPKVALQKYDESFPSHDIKESKS